MQLLGLQFVGFDITTCPVCGDKLTGVHYDGNAKVFRHAHATGNPCYLPSKFWEGGDADVPLPTPKEAAEEEDNHACAAHFRAAVEVGNRSHSSMDETGVLVAACNHDWILSMFTMKRGECYGYYLHAIEHLQHLKPSFISVDIMCRLWPWLLKHWPEGVENGELHPCLQRLCGALRWTIPMIGALHILCHEANCAFCWGPTVFDRPGMHGEWAEHVNAFLSQLAPIVNHCGPATYREELANGAHAFNSSKLLRMHMILLATARRIRRSLRATRGALVSALAAVVATHDSALVVSLPLLRVWQKEAVARACASDAATDPKRSSKLLVEYYTEVTSLQQLRLRYEWSQCARSFDLSAAEHELINRLHGTQPTLLTDVAFRAAEAASVKQQNGMMKRLVETGAILPDALVGASTSAASGRAVFARARRAAAQQECEKIIRSLLLEVTAKAELQSRSERGKVTVKSGSWLSAKIAKRNASITALLASLRASAAPVSVEGGPEEPLCSPPLAAYIITLTQFNARQLNTPDQIPDLPKDDSDDESVAAGVATSVSLRQQQTRQRLLQQATLYQQAFAGLRAAESDLVRLHTHTKEWEKRLLSTAATTAMCSVPLKQDKSARPGQRCKVLDIWMDKCDTTLPKACVARAHAAVNRVGGLGQKTDNLALAAEMDRQVIQLQREAHPAGAPAFRFAIPGPAVAALFSTVREHAPLYSWEDAVSTTALALQSVSNGVALESMFGTSAGPTNCLLHGVMDKCYLTSFPAEVRAATESVPQFTAFVKGGHMRMGSHAQHLSRHCIDLLAAQPEMATIVQEALDAELDAVASFRGPNSSAAELLHDIIAPFAVRAQ